MNTKSLKGAMIGGAVMAVLLCALAAPLAIGIWSVVQADADIPTKILDGPGAAMAFFAAFWPQGIWTQHVLALLLWALASFAGFTLFCWYQASYSSRDVRGGAYGDDRLWEGREATGKFQKWRGSGDGPTEPSLVLGSTRRAFYVDPGMTHALIIGQSGAGKGQLTLKETITYNLANGHNVIATGKSDVWEEFADKAEEENYQNCVFLDVNGYPCASSFNPLETIVAAYERGDESYVTRIDLLGTDLVPMESGNGKVFSDGCRDLLTGAITYVVTSDECPREQKNLATAVTLVQRLTTGPDPREPWAPLQALARSLPDDSPARASFMSALSDGKTTMAKNTLSTFNTYLKVFLQPTLRRVMDRSDFDVRGLLTQKSFVAINLLRDDHPYHLYYKAFFSQLAFEIDRVAEENGGELPRQLVLVGDEITAIGKLDCLPDWLKIGRSRGLHCYLVAQGLSAFAKYNRPGERDAGQNSVIDNCGIKMALTVANPDDAAYFSRICGKRSVMTISANESRGGGGRHEGTGRSEQAVDVVPASEFIKNSPLHGDGCIVHLDGGEAGKNRAGTYRLPMLPASRTLCGPYLGLGDKAHDAAKRSEFRKRAEARAGEKKPLSPTWCPDVEALMAENPAPHDPIGSIAREVEEASESGITYGLDEF